MRAAGGRLLYLEVRLTNLGGRAFYERRGFRRIGTRKGYYQHPPEDAVVMVKDV
jgi:ribosomal-protein-alanine N-acetyltransferase